MRQVDQIYIFQEFVPKGNMIVQLNRYTCESIPDCRRKNNPATINQTGLIANRQSPSSTSNTPKVWESIGRSRKRVSPASRGMIPQLELMAEAIPVDANCVSKL